MYSLLGFRLHHQTIINLSWQVSLAIRFREYQDQTTINLQQLAFFVRIQGARRPNKDKCIAICIPCQFLLMSLRGAHQKYPKCKGDHKEDKFIEVHIGNTNNKSSLQKRWKLIVGNLVSENWNLVMFGLNLEPSMSPMCSWCYCVNVVST